VITTRELTKSNIGPNDFIIDDSFWKNAYLRDSRQNIAMNIVLLSKWNNGKWLSFTWEDYKEKNRRDVSPFERVILDDLVNLGLLNCENGVYSVQDKLIISLADFIKKPNS